MILSTIQPKVLGFYFTILILSIIALTAEILPEYSAKLIVVPTLFLTIILIVLQITEKIKE